MGGLLPYLVAVVRQIVFIVSFLIPGTLCHDLGGEDDGLPWHDGDALPGFPGHCLVLQQPQSIDQIHIHVLHRPGLAAHLHVEGHRRALPGGGSQIGLHAVGTVDVGDRRRVVHVAVVIFAEGHEPLGAVDKGGHVRLAVEDARHRFFIGGIYLAIAGLVSALLHLVRRPGQADVVKDGDLPGFKDELAFAIGVLHLAGLAVFLYDVGSVRRHLVLAVLAFHIQGESEFRVAVVRIVAGHQLRH